MLVDNEGAINLAANPLSSARTKNIDVRFHFIRELVRTGMIAVEHIPTLGGLCPKERGSLRSLVFLSSPLVSSWSRGYCGHFFDWHNGFYMGYIARGFDPEAGFPLVRRF